MLSVNSKETILLAVPPKKNQKRYNFKQMLDYCEENKKEMADLTSDEKKQFVI